MISKKKTWLCRWWLILILAIAILDTVIPVWGGSRPEGWPDLRKTPWPRKALDLKKIPYKILHETYRKTQGKLNWEIFLMDADGSHAVNLTQTPDIDEMFPHVSPDGSKICFVVDEGKGANKSRNVYYMNIDGSNRVKVADNARQPCWSPDSHTIAYTQGEFKRFTIKDFASKGLYFYDIQSGRHWQHPNHDLYHLYAICQSHDGKWFLATVHGGMGFGHAILVFPTDGSEIYNLEAFGVNGCRPDFAPDDKRITWGLTDWDLCVADIDFHTGKPLVHNMRCLIQCGKKYKIYHTDFSPDGKYIAFSYGPKGQEQVGGLAPGWNICIADMNGTWVQVTTDGLHNKEPDWVPLPQVKR